MSNTKITSNVIESGAVTTTHIASGAISASHLTGVTTANITENTNLYYTDTRARSSISVTGGNLSYDNSTGVLQLTDSEIRDALSAGTGVTYSGGQISIGQAVGTSDTVTFGNITTTGYLRGPSNFTIDPAAYGDDTGTLIIAGNLQVDGTTTTINSTTLTVDDLNLTLASGAVNAAAANGAGITVDGASATLIYASSDDSWAVNKRFKAQSDIRLGSDGVRLSTDGNGEFGVGYGQTATNNRFTVYNNTTAAFRIKPDGKVGIGTSTPTFGKLQVEGAKYVLTDSGQARGGIHISPDSSATSGQYGGAISLSGGGSGSAAIASINDGGSDHDSVGLAFITHPAGTGGDDAQEKMRITETGNVGIGDISPAELLTVKDGNIKLKSNNDGNTGILMLYDAAGTQSGQVYPSAGDLRIWSNNDVLMLPTGNVGIGTDSPPRKLSVRSDTTITAGFNDIAEYLDTTIGAGGSVSLNIGRSNSTRNLGKMAFKFAGAGSTSNALNFGFYDADNLMTLFASGNVGIGDTSPSFKLDVNTTGSRARFKAATGDANIELSSIAGRDYVLQSLSSGSFRIYDEDANASRLIIDTAGGFNPTGVLYLGSGHLTNAPSDGVIAAAYADGYNNAGGDLELYGGRSTGDNGGGEIRFFTGAAGSPGTQINSHTRRMTINADGNVGIGVATPTELLHIKNPSNSWNEYARIRIGTETTDSYASEIGFHRGTSSDADRGFFIDGGGTGTQHFKVLHTGNVGIGTSSPGDIRLKVHSNDSDDYIAIFKQTHASNLGTVQIDTPSDSNARPSRLDFARGGVNKWKTGMVYGDSSDGWGLSDATGSGTAVQQTRFLVQPGGDVLIGTNTSLNVLSGTPKLQIGSGTGHASLQFYSGTTSVNGIYFGDTSSANNSRYSGYIEYRHNDNTMAFRASDRTVMTLKSNGPLLPAGDFGYHTTQEHYTSSSNPSSFSTATNTTYTSSTQYWPVEGEKLICVINARAYTRYLHIKTNLTANNIMFYFRTKGYFYGHGMEEQLVGGYTYYSGGNLILSKDNKRVAGDLHTADTYRATDGSLVLKVQVEQLGYTEGKMLVFFGSHAPSTVSGLTVVAVTQKDDGTNAF